MSLPLATDRLPPLQWSDSPHGLWRDGALLVMDMRHAAFPRRCLMTGDAGELVAHVHRTKYAKTPLLWLLAFGALGAMLYRANHGVEVVIRIPVSQRWLEQKRRQKLRGYWGLILAFLGIIVFALLAGILPIYGMFNAGLVAAAAMGGCIVAVLGAAIYLAINAAEVVQRAEGAYVWLTGCHRDVIASLPEFPGAYVLDAYVSQQPVPAELLDVER